MILHSVATVVDNHHVVEAGAIRVVRNVLIAIVAVVFLTGGVLGFLLGKAYGRRFRG